MTSQNSQCNIIRLISYIVNLLFELLNKVIQFLDSLINLSKRSRNLLRGCGLLLTDGSRRFNGLCYLCNRLIHFSQRCLYLLVESRDCSAIFLTSSATTAKPRPWSPARAASIAALSPRRFVCCAMPLMKSIT